MSDLGALADEVQVWVDANWDTSLTVGEWWARLTEAGYAYPTWPPGLGGAGATRRAAETVAVVLARNEVVAPPTGGVAAALAAPTVLEYGTPIQIRQLVRPIAIGETAWCQLFSEPGSGSDLASLGTRRNAMVTTGWSPARRCGTPPPMSPISECCSLGPISTSPSIGASPTS